VVKSKTYLRSVMFAPLIILVLVVLAVESKDSNGVKVEIERSLGRISPFQKIFPYQKISPYQKVTRNKRQIVAGERHSVGKKRRKEKRKKKTNCKKKPLQIKCVNKKFSKRLKAMEGRMKKYANKAKLGKVEKLLSSRMDKISENLTKNTNSINSSKIKLEEVANSLTALQSNMSSLWLEGAESVTPSNMSANGSTILEQLNATRTELIRMRESQLAISALVETQGQLLAEQMAMLDLMEERLNTTTVNSNVTVAQNISSSSNSSLSIQNSMIAASPTPAAVASNSSSSSNNNSNSSTVGSSAPSINQTVS